MYNINYGISKGDRNLKKHINTPPMVGTQAVSSLFFEINLTVELFACGRPGERSESFPAFHLREKP